MADLLDAFEAVLKWCRNIEDEESRLPLDLLNKSNNAFNAAQKQWFDEAKAEAAQEKPTYPCTLCHFTYPTLTHAEACFGQHRHAYETQVDEPPPSIICGQCGAKYASIEESQACIERHKTNITTPPFYCFADECRILHRTKQERDNHEEQMAAMANKIRMATYSEDLPVTLEQVNESLEHAIDAVCDLETRNAISAEYRKQIRIRYERDLKPFTFRLPVDVYDDIEVRAVDVTTAREMLCEWISDGFHATMIRVVRENIHNGLRYLSVDIEQEAKVFDANGNIIEV